MDEQPQSPPAGAEIIVFRQRDGPAALTLTPSAGTAPDGGEPLRHIDQMVSCVVGGVKQRCFRLPRLSVIHMAPMSPPLASAGHSRASAVPSRVRASRISGGWRTRDCVFVFNIEIGPQVGYNAAVGCQDPLDAVPQDRDHHCRVKPVLQGRPDERAGASIRSSTLTPDVISCHCNPSDSKRVVASCRCHIRESKPHCTQTSAFVPSNFAVRHYCDLERWAVTYRSSVADIRSICVYCGSSPAGIRHLLRLHGNSDVCLPNAKSAWSTAVATLG